MHRDLTFPGPVAILPASSLETRLAEAQRAGRGLPTRFDQIVTDLARRPAVPATVADPLPGRKDKSLVLYTYRYTVRLFPTQHGDAYRVVSINPLWLRDHETLANACLLLRAQWVPVPGLPQIPPASHAGWDRVLHEWAELHRDPGDARRTPGLSPAHEAFLGRLDRLIDVTREFEARKTREQPRYPYRAIESTTERRYSAAPVYVFRLAGPARPERNRFVRVRGEDRQRGEVVRVDGDRVTVRFDDRLGRDRLPPQGELEETANDVMTAQRREAARMLREGQSANPGLLTTLVDHRFLPLHPVDAKPRATLDPGQETAYRSALAVGDLMIVLGPPGTGKTRTISQIALTHAVSAPGQVLVASHTNRAVDNVLGRLPPEVVVVRVGNEGKVGAEGRPFLLERQAAELRGEILRETKLALDQYDGLPAAAEWTSELARRAATAHEAATAEEAARSALHIARREAGGATVNQLAAAEKALARSRAKHDAQSARLHRLTARHTRLTARAGRPLIPAWTALLARRRAARIDAAGERLAERTAQVARAESVVADAAAELERVTRDEPRVRTAVEWLTARERHRVSTTAEAIAAVSAVQEHLGDLAVVPPIPGGRDARETRAALDAVCAWTASAVPELQARAKLLRDWRTAADGDTAQLHPELLQYADVIGATCVGAGSREETSGRTFDLVIVDEAGQIGTADLLVPLVRARRAVLVGDHRQLPPFVDQELVDWTTDLGDEQLARLVRHSALENLVGVLPARNVVQLTEQRRMPKVIADYISEAFYEGKLVTRVERPHTDALFSSPLAFVDTSALPRGKRGERAASTWKRQVSGWVNHAEARMLADLSEHYRARGAEWAVIVPYAAQRDLVRELLGQEFPDLEQIDEHVGTVDSFQGGERDVILYGFTRSNDGGYVGFLQELRRANVAFTRARRQLVLVGDAGMLTRARDARFRELGGGLLGHVRAHGDLRSFQDISKALHRNGKGLDFS